MSMKPCRECKTEVSTDAAACPKCGKRNPTRGTSKIVMFGGSLVAFFVVWGFFAVGTQKGGAMIVDDAYRQVAADAVTQYEIASRNGTKMDKCMAAMGVSAAFLQSKNEPQYKAAKDRERVDCKAAGMPQN